MKINQSFIAAVCAGALLFAAGIAVGANKFAKPSTILHVITVKFKPEATDAQKDAARKGVEKMAAEIPGIKAVWTKGIKVQGEGFTDAFVMEFESQRAFYAYADHASHKAWEEIYLPIRAQSTTHDITN